MPEEAFSQCPVEALHDALVPVDVNPTAQNMDRVLRQQLTDGAHELSLRINLKKLRPPQGAPLVNPRMEIGDLCRFLASQGLSLFVAAGDGESITEGFLSYVVVLARRAGLLDGPCLVPPCQISAVVCVVEQANRSIDGLLLELSHLCCRRQLFYGCEPPSVTSGTVVNG